MNDLLRNWFEGSLGGKLGSARCINGLLVGLVGIC